MENKIQIRNVRLSDAKALAEINVLCWQKNYRGLIQDDYLNQMSITPKRIEYKKEMIQKSRQTKDLYFCAVKNGQVVGYLQGKKKTKESPAPYVVLYFYIHPDFQHQGIGSQLLEHFKEKINFQPFYLYMLKGNTKAQKFYKKMGGVQQPKSMDIESKVYNFLIHEVCFIFDTSFPQISSFLTIKKMTTQDIPEILKLCQTNPDYYQHMPPKVSDKTIQKDLKELPPHTTIKDKFYLGFYDQKELVAILDLIYNYPNKKSCFIGLFMVDKKKQGKDLGSKIIQELLTFLFKSHTQVQLGVIDSHTLSHQFWIKNGFQFTGKEYRHLNYTVKMMQAHKK